MKSGWRPWGVGAILVVTGPGILWGATAQAEPSHDLDRGAAVQLGDDDLFVLSEDRGRQSAAVRAAGASRILEEAARRRETKASAQLVGNAARITIGKQLVIELDASDAEAAEEPRLDDYAAETARLMQSALEREKGRREIADRVLAVSGVVFFGFIAWFLIGLVGREAKRLLARLEQRRTPIGAVQMRQFELLPAAATREAMRLSIRAAVWVARAGLAYFWVLAALSLFEPTRPLASQATTFLFAPAVDLVGQLVTRLPLLFALFLTLLVVLAMVRFITLYCAAIERKEIESEWIRPETARTSGTLLAVALSLGALLFVTPLFAGTADGSLPRIGLLGVGAIALGATPLLGSCLLGLRLVYGKPWTLGDQITYGGQSGRALRLGLFDATLLTDDGAEVRVPHLMSLWHPTRIYPDDQPAAGLPPNPKESSP